MPDSTAAPQTAPARPSPPADLPRVAPGPRLSPRGLVLGFVAVFALGAATYAMFPDAVGGPPLPVSVDIDRDVYPGSDPNSPIVGPVIRLTNGSNDPIAHVTLILNKHYRLDRASPIGAGETWTLPAVMFTNKRSSQRFAAEVHPIEKVVVNGQLPDARRGVSVFEFENP